MNKYLIISTIRDNFEHLSLGKPIIHSVARIFLLAEVKVYKLH